jgi:hypothetical protein
MLRNQFTNSRSDFWSCRQSAKNVLHHSFIDDSSKLFEMKLHKKWGPHLKDREGRERSNHMVLRSYYIKVLTDDLLSLILSLDYHYHLKRNFQARFARTFLKVKTHLKRSEEWIAMNDSVAMKAHKTNYILQLLKSVDEECFEDHETHYKCPGFFKEVVNYFDIETKSCPLPVLSSEEHSDFTHWTFSADRRFLVTNYPREEQHLSETK